MRLAPHPLCAPSDHRAHIADAEEALAELREEVAEARRLAAEAAASARVIIQSQTPPLPMERGEASGDAGATTPVRVAGSLDYHTAGVGPASAVARPRPQPPRIVDARVNSSDDRSSSGRGRAESEGAGFNGSRGASLRPPLHPPVRPPPAPAPAPPPILISPPPRLNLLRRGRSASVGGNGGGRRVVVGGLVALVRRVCCCSGGVSDADWRVRDAEAEVSSLRAVLASMESLHAELLRELEALQAERQRVLDAQTWRGWLFNLLGYALSVVGGWRRRRRWLGREGLRGMMHRSTLPHLPCSHRQNGAGRREQ